ncbi:hypothetical protein BH24ACT9_BH24ACT9_04850 [soil metagenome]
MTGERRFEELLRELAPQVLSALVRRYGGFDTFEDAVQEALLAASLQWSTDGVPDNPHGWLCTVASRRHTELGATRPPGVDARNPPPPPLARPTPSRLRRSMTR